MEWKVPTGISFWPREYFLRSTNLFAVMNIFIRSIQEYVSGVSNENPEGNTRVLVTFQSYAQTEASALFAGKTPDGAKIGSMSLHKGVTLEQANTALKIGSDMSATHSWGALKDITNDDGTPNKVLFEVLLGSAPATPE